MPSSKKVFLPLFAAVIISMVMGILFHELGHWAGARYAGRDAKVSYAHTRMLPNEDVTMLKKFDTGYGKDVKGWTTYPPLSYINVLKERLDRQDIIFTSAGPIFTLFTSFFALIFLLFTRRTTRFGWQQWACILIALFSIRGIIGPIKDIAVFARARATNAPLRSAMFSDEINLAALLQWNMWSLPLASVIISLCIVGYAIQRVPAAQRKMFAMAFIAAGLATFVLWFLLLGPLLLP